MKVQRINHYNHKSALVLFIIFNIFAFSISSFSFGNTRNFENINDPSLKQKKPHNYCIAIRGNGELMPAHWGALAQTVEYFGVPQGIAGGSSGSLSAFLMESFMMNPILQDPTLDLETKSTYLAFMIKSLEGFLTFYTDRPQFQHFIASLKLLVDIGGEKHQWPQRLESFFKIYPTPAQAISAITQVQDLLIEAQNSQVFYGPQVVRFHNAIKNLTAYSVTHQKDLNDPSNNFVSIAALPLGHLIPPTHSPIEHFNTEYTKLKEAISVFGSFNAKDDKALFYRSGIVNFKALARVFGFIANFYSLKNSSVSAQKSFQHFLSTCASSTIGKTWQEITEGNQNPHCQRELYNTIHSYISSTDPSSNKLRINDRVGDFFPTLVSTSVVVGSSDIKNLKEQQKLYNTKTSGELKSENYLKTLEYLPIKNSHLKFGYWGKANTLKAIQNFINKNQNKMASTSDLSDQELLSDAMSMDKTKRFLALGETSWETALSLSPAEPGLSSMLPFKNHQGVEYMSLGGWSDLLPIPVLKWMGCENVVYLTRRGGESFFAQGIAKRIFQFQDIPWQALDTSKTDQGNKNRWANDVGYSEHDLKSLSQNDPEKRTRGANDPITTWSEMFNLANPKSAFNISLKMSDAVVCTNWNAFNIKKDFHEMITQAYTAPIYNPSQLETASSSLKSIKKPIFIESSDSTLVENLVPQHQVPRFAGCVFTNDTKK